MPETGGPAAQAGLHYQNSVAALALTELLVLEEVDPREQVVEVRVEAPEPVNDVVVRFADGHRDFQSVKLGLRRGGRVWRAMWESLAEQVESASFGPDDRLTVVVEETSTASRAMRELCERAAVGGLEALQAGLPRGLGTLLAGIAGIVGSERCCEVARRTRVLHRPLEEIERGIRYGRRTAGAPESPQKTLSILRDIVAQAGPTKGGFSTRVAETSAARRIWGHARGTSAVAAGFLPGDDQAAGAY